VEGESERQMYQAPAWACRSTAGGVENGGGGRREGTKPHPELLVHPRSRRSDEEGGPERRPPGVARRRGRRRGRGGGGAPSHHELLVHRAVAGEIDQRNPSLTRRDEVTVPREGGKEQMKGAGSAVPFGPAERPPRPRPRLRAHFLF